MTPDLPSLPDLPATNYRLGIEGNGYGSDDRLLFESGYSDEDMRSYGRACYELGARSTAAQPAGFKLLKDTTYEERSWPEDAAHENGNYSCCCVICLRQFTGHKRRVVCKVCYAAPPAAAQPADAGPWSLTEAGSLQSADFTHDVQLGISGDFTNKDERLAYARGLCAKLNAAAAQPARLTIDELARTAYLVFCDAQDDSGWESLNDGERQSFTRVAEALNGTIAEMGSAAAQPVEPTVTPTEAVVGFASWVTCRPGTLPAGEGHDAAPWSEAVHEFVVAQGWPTVRDVFPHNLKRPPLSAPPAASGDSTPPSEPAVWPGAAQTWKWMTHPHWNEGFPIPVLLTTDPDSGEVWYQPFSTSCTDFEWACRDKEWAEVAAPVQGDPSGALRPEPESTEPDCHGLDTRGRVRFYEHDFYVLSNFSAFSLKWKGHTFPTSEHAYHWEKFAARTRALGDGMYVRDEILDAPSAHEAFKIAERVKNLRRPDWDDLKVDIMRDILRAKATQHEYVRRKLLATGDRYLVEDSWRDDFWGWGPNRDGKNMLGRLWMEVRAEFRAAEPPQAASGSRGD